MRPVKELGGLVVTGTHEAERDEVSQHRYRHDIPLVAGVVLLPVDGAGRDGGFVAIAGVGKEGGRERGR